MPMSGPVEAVGTLNRNRQGYVLNTDGGGHWELGHVPGVSALVGCRVRVEGTRCGFNAIACRRLWKEGEPRPRRKISSGGALGDWLGRLALSLLVFLVLLSLTQWAALFAGEARVEKGPNAGSFFGRSLQLP